MITARVSIALERAIVCGNGCHVYDGYEWNRCPTCDSDDGVFLVSFLGETKPGVGAERES